MREKEKITLKNMLHSAYVGAADWEREVPARVEIDLEIYADLTKACKTDDLNDTINYSEIYDIVAGFVKAKHHNLLESLAEEIAGGVLEHCDCEKVIVRVRKLQPPLTGLCDYAEVEIIRLKS